MNDRQLRYMLTVDETRSISAAARQLYISQPSLSAMILSIEKELGTPLFDRSTSPLTLTYAGECYMQAAREILSTERDMLRKIKDNERFIHGPLSIGCSSATSSMIMTFLIPKFLKLYPEVRLQIIEDHVPALGNRLKTGEADVLCCPNLANEENFEKQILSKEDMVLLAPRDFRPDSLVSLPERDFPTFDFSLLNGKPFALMKTGHMTRDLQETVLKEEAISAKIILETERWETCVSMVENNLAFTMLPYSKLKRDVLQDNICAYSIHADVHREVCLYWRSNALLPRVTKTFLEFSKAEYAAL